jgi:hypothetical protein
LLRLTHARDAGGVGALSQPNRLGQGSFDGLNRSGLKSCEYQLLTRNPLARRL